MALLVFGLQTWQGDGEGRLAQAGVGEGDASVAGSGDGDVVGALL